MAYCEHRPHCANSACVVRRQRAGLPLPGQEGSLLARGIRQNPPCIPPFPINDANPRFPEQQKPPSYPGHADIEPPLYSYSQPITIPQPAPPAPHLVNAWYPPNPHTQYAPHELWHSQFTPGQSTPGQSLPPWLRNRQMAPMPVAGPMTPVPVVGPMAPMPPTGYTTGLQHPLSVTAPHPSKVLIRTAGGKGLIPQERPGTAHPWIHGGGNEWDNISDSRDQSTDDDDDDGVHRTYCCIPQRQRVSSQQCIFQADPELSENEKLHRQDQDRSEEDLRQAAQFHDSSPEHVLHCKELRMRRKTCSAGLPLSSLSVQRVAPSQSGDQLKNAVDERCPTHRSIYIRESPHPQSHSRKPSDAEKTDSISGEVTLSSEPRDSMPSLLDQNSLEEQHEPANHLRGGDHSRRKQHSKVNRSRHLCVEDVWEGPKLRILRVDDIFDQFKADIPGHNKCHVLRSHRIPHQADPSDPGYYYIITQSLPAERIQFLAGETCCCFDYLPHRGRFEAERQRDLEDEDSARSEPDDTLSEFDERYREYHGQVRENNNRIDSRFRGGASSPEDDGSLSPLSPFGRPHKTINEYHRRLQASSENYGRDQSLSEGDGDRVETGNISSRDTSHITRSRRNLLVLDPAGGLSLDEEDTPEFRSASRSAAQPNSRPQHHVLPDRRSNGNNSDESATFATQPQGQQPQIWDAVDLYNVPPGGSVNVARNGVDLFTWRVSDAAGFEFRSGESYDPPAVGGGSRTQESIPGLSWLNGRFDHGEDDRENDRENEERTAADGNSRRMDGYMQRESSR